MPAEAQAQSSADRLRASHPGFSMKAVSEAKQHGLSLGTQGLESRGRSECSRTAWKTLPPLPTGTEQQ